MKKLVNKRHIAEARNKAIVLAAGATLLMMLGIGFVFAAWEMPLTVGSGAALSLCAIALAIGVRSAAKLAIVYRRVWRKRKARYNRQLKRIRELKPTDFDR